MKKRIFILLIAVFIAAILSDAYGQSLTTAPVGKPVPVTVTCLSTAGPLAPIPGTPYDYDVTVTVPSGTPTFTYDWFVIQDPEFVATSALNSADIEALTSGSSVHIAAVGSGAGLSNYHSTTSSTGKINITWQSFIHSDADPVFLVIYVKNTATCATDNIQVYIIKPQHAFTLDIANLKADGTSGAANYATCVSPIVAANYVSPNVVMDYGQNYIYYAVTASNFNHSWKPAFQVNTSNALGTSTVQVDWAYPAESHGATPTWHSTTLSAGTYSSTDVVNASATTATVSGAVGAAGEYIVVRVLVDHNLEPTLVDNSITLSVDGVMRDPSTSLYATALLGDIHSTDGGAGNPCPWVDGFTNDKAIQVISARPTITSAPATGAFVPKTN